MKTNFTIIAVHPDGTHDTHTNLEDRAALERRHDALLRAGYTECRILVIETTIDGDRQVTSVATHFNRHEVLINRNHG
jgi:hypothetical protein